MTRREPETKAAPMRHFLISIMLMLAGGLLTVGVASVMEQRASQASAAHIRALGK